MSDIQVLPEDFEPTRRGRMPNVDIEDLTDMADGNQGKWVSQSFTNAQAASALRQLKKQGYKYDVVSKKDGDGRVVFVKRI